MILLLSVVLLMFLVVAFGVVVDFMGLLDLLTMLLLLSRMHLPLTPELCLKKVQDQLQIVRHSKQI